MVDVCVTQSEALIILAKHEKAELNNLRTRCRKGVTVNLALNLKLRETCFSLAYSLVIISET